MVVVVVVDVDVVVVVVGGLGLVLGGHCLCPACNKIPAEATTNRPYFMAPVL